MTLSQKETSLLQDLRNQEQLCVEKYGRYAREACDRELADLFAGIGRQEQQHLDTIRSMLSGIVPSANSGGQGQQQGGSGSGQAAYGTLSSDPNKSHDAYLCQDTLSEEKHVSHTYDTCIFEFKDAQTRNALNHIQKEEQEHGKQIYDYMSKNGMYA